MLDWLLQGLNWYLGSYAYALMFSGGEAGAYERMLREGTKDGCAAC